MAAPTATTVPGFTHRPGHHCGSTALRNLLRFHGVEVSEELAFGLGAGACFYYFVSDDLSPTRFTNGRTGRLEETFLELTGAPLALTTEPDPDAAWDRAREVVDAGRPVLLITDLYHLDHYGNSAHFPGHAVVLAGYDDEHAYVADTAFEALQRTSLEGLARARHEQHPFYPLAGHMIDVPGEPPSIDELRAAAPVAIARAARRMNEPDLGEFEGLPALRRFAAEVGEWPAATGDWRWSARFNYQVIERRGTGGGNFRALYSRFLAEVGRTEEEPLAAAAASDWTALATELHAASETDEPDPAGWQRIGAAAASVLAAEERLWSALSA
ncbi:MAG TPA: BtrH N-terminal domain-containing protein [Solirubrobacterales bacterium]|nr:BtrH N-terminal domain-containing protein [Solirubrobacterales bacterium]